MKHFWKAVVGVTVTVLMLWWVLADVPFHALLSNIRQGNVVLLVASVFMATFGFFIRALRWKILLTPVREDTRLRSRFAGISIGFMANNILPARVGEFARAYAFSRLEPVSATAAFGTVVVERFMDGTVLLLFLVLPMLTPDFPSVETLSSGSGLAMFRFAIGLVLTVLTALVAMAVMPRRFIGVANGLSGMLPGTLGPRLVDSLRSFLASIAIMTNPRLLASGFAWSLFLWTWHGASFWLGMLAFDIHTGFVSAIFTEAVVGFGVAIPSAPGFFGTFHFATNFALTTVYGVPETQSLAFAFAYHFGGWIPITVIGLGYASVLGLSLGEVGHADEQFGADAA